MKSAMAPLFFVDLEGVLVPEMWPFLAESFEVTELRETTREIPDYVALMEKRIRALRRDNIDIGAIREALRDLSPLPGALEFVQDLKQRGTVVLVSDSFEPMNCDLVSQFFFDKVICHRFQIDGNGMIVGCIPWNDFQGKHLCFDLLSDAKRDSFAVGDALNDLEMLRRATKGVLYCPSSATRLAAPDIQVALGYEDVLAEFDNAIMTVSG